VCLHGRTEDNTIMKIDLDGLRKYDTPTVCNVIELFDLYPRTAGYMDGRIVACYPKLPPMVGFASTATFRSASPPKVGKRVRRTGCTGRIVCQSDQARRSWYFRTSTTRRPPRRSARSCVPPTRRSGLPD
jgi:hypothetical protein